MLVKTARRKMARILILLLGGLVVLCAGHGVFMDKLSSKKLCADEECVCKALLTVWFLLSFYHIMGNLSGKQPDCTLQ